MGRTVILFIMLCYLIISSSCSSAKDVIYHDKSNSFAMDSHRKYFEIHEKLFPRQYEGSNDSSLFAIITHESIDTIPEWCFSRIPSLKKVILQGKRIVVESNAFYACKKLQKVYLNNVIKCSENAFKMTSVDSVNINRCEYIDDFAFANCNSLCSVSFSDSLKRIGDFAFSSDTALVKIYIPNGEIGSCCFMGCSKLHDVILGNVSVIGESAFLDCISLCEITIPESVLEIKSEAFVGCSSLKVIRVLNRRTQIAVNAFDNNTIIEYQN